MQFQSVKSALVTALGLAAASRYRTVGYKDEPIDQSEISGNNKLVSVYYSKGNLPLNKSGRFGPVIHECSFDVELKLSQACSVNVAVLENPNSSAAALTAALAGLQNAKSLADTNLDSFISIIFGILMDSRNAFLGLSKSVFADRWISNIDKKDPMVFGDMVISTAVLTYTCDVEESLDGDSGHAGIIIDMTYKLNEESTGQTGVQIGEEPEEPA